VKLAALCLFILVDLLGSIGAIMVAVPFLREHGLKRLLTALRRPSVAGMPRAIGMAQTKTEAELARFKPGDGAYVGWGLVVISLSYLLHIVAELLEHLAPA